MSSTLTEILNWAATLNYWEQATLDKIISGKPIKEDDLVELLQYFLEDAGLAIIEKDRKKCDFNKYVATQKETSKTSLLLSISDLKNVNALVPNQRLTFSPQLTVIYGANGSGKSGYARVLGCAGFTRGDKEVLPDITKSIPKDEHLTARIHVKTNSKIRDNPYQIGESCPELASFYVFDSTSVRAHLSRSNAYSFSPAGLSYLTDLVDVTDQVRARLKKRIEEHRQPHNLTDLFPGKSWVTELLAIIGPDTSTEFIRQVATLSNSEQSRISDLDIEIAKIKARNLIEERNQIIQDRTDLIELKKSISNILDSLSDGVVDEISQLVQGYLQWEESARVISIDQFKSDFFEHVGSDEWTTFISAAKALAELEMTIDEPYPTEESICLLCNQELSKIAKEHITQLWEYLDGEARLALKEIRSKMSDKQTEIFKLKLDFFSEESVYSRLVKKYNVALHARLVTVIASCNTRKTSINSILLEPKKDFEFEQLSDFSPIELDGITEQLNGFEADLDKVSSSHILERLEGELLSLQHRQIMKDHVETVVEYIEGTKWAKRAASVVGSTAHITKKYKELFTQLVTDKYLDLFRSLVKNMQRPLKIDVKTTGKKGETIKQIVLEKVHPDLIEEATPEKVLSEGEKRAVALADFLTEVALDTESHGIVLDDPVTSLDWEWRDKIAQIVANEAVHRQVIVFTHELSFLYFLKKYAEDKDVQISTHWVKRGDDDDRPGHVWLDNCPTLDRAYRKPTRARNLYKQAKDASPAKQEALLSDGFAALRTTYEAFIIFNLLNEVVMRFEERISFGRLKDVVWHKPIITKVIDKCEMLSKYMEGHLHSGMVSKVISPKLLLEEIEEFDALKKQHTALVKKGKQ